mgnify:CR=1 FL=1
MRCPHLVDVREVFCLACSYKRLPLHQVNVDDDRCSTAAHRDCKWYARSTSRALGDAPSTERCPLLKSELYWFCELDPHKRRIPCNHELRSLCTSGGHRSCDLYATLGRAIGPSDCVTQAPEGGGLNQPVPPQDLAQVPRPVEEHEQVPR